MQALVTGAGGFVGGAIARLLVQQGYAVRGYSRGSHPQLEAAGIVQHRGALSDTAALVEAARGCDVLFHVAAKVGASGSREAFEATNIDGTRRVIAACEEAGVPVLVFTSSPSVVFDGSDMEGVDESVAYPDHHEALYPETKAAAERLVLAANGPGLRTVSIRPHLVWGPGDSSLLPRLVQRSKAGRLRRIAGPPKHIDVTYIQDAARAHVLAAERLRGLASHKEAPAGRAYFISGGEPVETWWMVDRMLEAVGAPPAKGAVPRWLALAVATLLEFLHGLLRLEGEPALTPWAVRELTTAHWFDIGAARRELGYEPELSVEQGLAELGRWAAQQEPTEG